MRNTTNIEHKIRRQEAIRIQINEAKPISNVDYNFLLGTFKNVLFLLVVFILLFFTLL